MNTSAALPRAFRRLNPQRAGAPFWLALMLTVAFCLATWLVPAFDARQPTGREDPLAVLLGDGRRMLADLAFVKADVYFHSGFYPTLFDSRQAHQTPHLAEDAGVVASRNAGGEDSFLGPPADWIEAHNRQHRPNRHTHLGADAHVGGSSGSEREILPWMKLAGTLDPSQAEYYTVTAYWLRRLNRPEQAEACLREGLRANPGSPEILFELGRSRFQAADFDRARNLWAGAWQRWKQRELAKPEAAHDRFLAALILLHLAQLESRAGDRAACEQWLLTLLPYAVNRSAVEKRLEDVRAGRPFEAVEAASPNP